MPFSRRGAAVVIACVSTLSAPSLAATPRDTLIRAAFATRDKGQALALVNQALADARAILARTPGDREAQLQAALATGYRGQLARSPGDARATKHMLDALVAANPRDPEYLIALAGWHLTAVGDLGGFLARTLLGAIKDQGLGALDKAVALGGDRAFFPAYAALIRVRIDSGDTTKALALAQRASTAQAPGAIDRVMQRAAIRILPLLKAGNGTGASKLARTLLPFGMIG